MKKKNFGKKEHTTRKILPLCWPKKPRYVSANSGPTNFSDFECQLLFFEMTMLIRVNAKISYITINWTAPSFDGNRNVVG